MELLAQLQEWSLDLEIERQQHEINKQLKVLRAGAAVAQAAHNHPVPGSTPGPATKFLYKRAKAAPGDRTLEESQAASKSAEPQHGAAEQENKSAARAAEPGTNLSAALKPWPASPITYPTGAVDGAADTPLRRGQPGPAGFKPSSPEADSLKAARSCSELHAANTVNMVIADQAPAAAGDTYDKVHVFPKGRWS